MKTFTLIGLVAMAIVAITNQPGSAEPQVVSQTTTTRLLGPGLGVGGFGGGVGAGFGVGGFGGGFRPGFGGVGPGFGGGFGPGFGGVRPGFGGGFGPGFGGVRPGFGGGFGPGFGGGFGPGFGGGFGPGFGGGFGPRFRPGFAINPPPRPIIRPVFSPVAGVVPAVVGFRGRSGDSDDTDASISTGCRHWCTNPLTGEAFCCRTAHEPHAPVGTKPGQCPPLRPSCPTGGGFGGPSSCSSDGGCAGVDKCCYDTCLQANVCKPPGGFGR